MTRRTRALRTALAATLRALIVTAVPLIVAAVGVYALLVPPATVDATASMAWRLVWASLPTGGGLLAAYALLNARRGREHSARQQAIGYVLIAGGLGFYSVTLLQAARADPVVPAGWLGAFAISALTRAVQLWWIGEELHDDRERRARGPGRRGGGSCT